MEESLLIFIKFWLNNGILSILKFGNEFFLTAIRVCFRHHVHYNNDIRPFLELTIFLS